MNAATRIRIVALLASFIVTAEAGPPTFTLTVDVDGYGTVVLDPDREAYKRNNIVNLEAIPDEGYVFHHWVGDLSGDANPVTLRVSDNHSVTAVFVEAGGGGGGGGPLPRDPLPESGMLISYFTSWSVYRRAYYPADIVSSGAAEALDVINYAFAGIDENYRCAILDQFADYEKRFDASETVDGFADDQAQPLKGNFNQLRKLKQMHAGLRVMISIGGWTESHRFSQAAMPENRAAFIESCVDMFIHGILPEGVDASGVFDGIDIDWEYPGACGATCDFDPQDPQNFVALLNEFRIALEKAEDDVESATGSRPEYLLTIAAPAGEDYYSLMLGGDPLPGATLSAPLDWINVMAYDFHGGWEGNGPANHMAPLHISPCDDPETADYGDKAIRAYLDSGVPANKLLLGVPFYGRGWRGVAAANDGLCNPARGVPRGTYEKGVDDYEVLANSGDPEFPSDPDADRTVNWTFDGSEFWSFDDAESLGEKAKYVNSNGLRGVMSWDLSADDPDGTLMRALADRLVRQ